MNSQIPHSGKLAVAGNRIAALVSVLVRPNWLRFRSIQPRAVSLSLIPKLEIFREQGWPFFNLVLVNRTSRNTWAEEVSVVLSELSAESQSDGATCHGSLKIRTFVAPGETRSVCLVETVYIATGRPQGTYSFVVSGVIRYRVDDEWSEMALQPCRIKMCALTPLGLQHIASSRRAEEQLKVTRMALERGIALERSVATAEQDRLEQSPLEKQGVGR